MLTSTIVIQGAEGAKGARGSQGTRGEKVQIIWGFFVLFFFLFRRPKTKDDSNGFICF